MNRRWSCPVCGVGVLAPGRMRKDNALRYCLACTEKTGKLVERVCDALEKERVAKKTAASERAKVERAKERTAKNAKWMVGSMDLRAELDWMVKHFELARRPTIEIKRGSSRSHGHAYYGSRRNPGSVFLTIGAQSTSPCATVWELLLHEVIHSFGLPHGVEMCAEVDRACYERWGVDVKSAAGGYPSGRVGTEKTYGFDHAAVAAIKDEVARVYTDPPRPPSRMDKLKAQWKTGALRINQDTQSAFEIDAVILEPIKGSNDADLDDKAMVEWVEQSARKIGRSRYYVLEVTKDNVHLARVLVRELNEWAWDFRAGPFSRWANILEGLIAAAERKAIGESLEAAIAAPLTRA